MIAPIDPPPHDPAFLEHADVLRHGMDERVGGKSEFGFDRRGMVVRVVIDSLEPGKGFACPVLATIQNEWADTTLEWKVEATSKGSILHFAHRGWREITPFAAGCNSDWGELMFRLKEYGEPKRANPRWSE